MSVISESKSYSQENPARSELKPNQRIVGFRTVLWIIYFNVGGCCGRRSKG